MVAYLYIAIACIHTKEDADIIQILIDHQHQKHRIVQLNSNDNQYRTPSHTACSSQNNVRVVEVLKHATVIDIHHYISHVCLTAVMPVIIRW